ncbi:MAG: DUF1847 domain-containing protein [Chlorobi bacterium]|nr:DUF1847 domain-containing protein [Chlorobiota bacterium]
MEKESFSHLYDEDDRHILKVAEDTIDRSVDRIAEIISYARESGIRKIGIANCTTFTREAKVFQEMLVNEGFEVERVHCKYGRMPFNDILDGYDGISCNPAGQAKYLEQKGTELNVMMGLCLGHDMIFNAKSKAPVTPLIVKDRKLKHKTFEMLKPKK